MFRVFFICACFLWVFGTLWASVLEACEREIILYNGHIKPECVEYAVELSHQGIDNENALKFSADKWHFPKLKLFCGKESRRNFAKYSVFQFYIKADHNVLNNIQIKLTTWNKFSRELRIRDYLQPEIRKDNYKLVSIPIAEFVVDDWDLGNVETIEWQTDDNHMILVSNLVLRQTKPIQLLTDIQNAPFPESNRVLRLTYDKRWDPETVNRLENYRVSSSTDSEFAHSVNPNSIGIEFHVSKFNRGGNPEIIHLVYLQLPTMLKNEHVYTLRVSGISDEFCNVMAPTEYQFTYNDKILMNPNIKINQEGYLPDGKKMGYFGGYAGSLGGGIWIIGAGNKILHRGPTNEFIELVIPSEEKINGISGLDHSDLYLVGNYGTIFHWDGKSWTKCTSPTDQDLYAVHFTAKGTGWAVGNAGTILKFQDNLWKQVASPLDQALRAIWSDGDSNVWVVGDRGTILFWNGSRWSVEKSGSDSHLQSISGSSKDNLWAVGSGGTLLHRKWGKWEPVPIKLNTSKNLNAVLVESSGKVWVAGAEGLLWIKAENDEKFKSVATNTSENLTGLAQQNNRSMWIVGEKGSLLFCGYPDYKCQLEPIHTNYSFSSIFCLPFGPLRLPKSSQTVEILEIGKSQVVQSIPLKLEHANWYLSGEDVYTFDFSSITTPGEYIAHIPGIGVSHPFRIGNDALNKAAFTTGRAFYYQRCGTSLVQPYSESRFTRPACHLSYDSGEMIDGVYHKSVIDSPLHSEEQIGKFHAAAKGWHDAGDYGKYVPTAVSTLWYLFTGYEIDPEKFQKLSWNIPESGNGIPDILNEARWELQWLANMQAPDGGVYHKLTSETWFEGMPQNDQKPRFLFSKTTHDTASASAIFASAARLFRPFDESTSKSYLSRALQAWNFLKKYPQPIPKNGFENPDGTVTGEYRDPKDEDNRLWAAAELYRATGAEEFRQYFEHWWSSNSSHPWGWNEWQDFYKCAYWAYLRSDHPSSATIRKELVQGITKRAEQIVQRTWSNPYKNGARLDVPQWIGWGTFTHGTKYSFELLQAWLLTKREEFRDAALVNVDTQLGANPLSMSFITGLGSNHPANPLHLPSMFDTVADPIPGIPIFGVAAHLPNTQYFYREAQKDENNFPYRHTTADPYPILRRYVDTSELVPMSEFTIVEIASSAVVLGLLANPVVAP